MKGRIGQRAFYDRLPGMLADAMAEWAQLTGRRYGADRARTAARTPSEIVVAMGTIADTRHGRGRPAARAQAAPVGCRRGDRRSGRSRRTSSPTALRHAAAIAVDRAHRRACGRRQPADARDQGGPLRRWPADGTRVPRVVSVVRRARLARRGRRRPRRRLRLARRPRRACADAPYAVLGIRHPLALDAGPDRHPAARRLQRPRPLDRRLRVGHDEQAARDPRRRAVRPPGAGLPALRVGEEGPARRPTT